MQKESSPDRYKLSIVKGFLYRARDLCSEKADMLIEISRSKQILINNGYSNRLVDAEISRFLKKTFPPAEAASPTQDPPSTTSSTTTATTAPPAAAETQTATSTTTPPTGTTHKVFFQNFMNPNYKQDEREI